MPPLHPPTPIARTQDNWEAVLLLATDTSPSAPASAASPPGCAGGGELAPGTHVRRRVVELMELVLRWVEGPPSCWKLLGLACAGVVVCSAAVSLLSGGWFAQWRAQLKMTACPWTPSPPHCKLFPPTQPHTAGAAWWGPGPRWRPSWRCAPTLTRMYGGVRCACCASSAKSEPLVHTPAAGLAASKGCAAVWTRHMPLPVPPDTLTCQPNNPPTHNRYPRYLDADRLCSGVDKAYAFRAALAQVGGWCCGWRDGGWFAPECLVCAACSHPQVASDGAPYLDVSLRL